MAVELRPLAYSSLLASLDWLVVARVREKKKTTEMGDFSRKSGPINLNCIDMTISLINQNCLSTDETKPLFETIIITLNPFFETYMGILSPYLK